MFIACSKDEENSASMNYEILKMGSLSYDNQTELEIPKGYSVFETEESWDAYLTTLSERNTQYHSELKDFDFDFTNQDAILVTGSYFYSCCSLITVKKVYEEETQTIVDFTESDTGIISTISQAYVVLVIDN